MNRANGNVFPGGVMALLGLVGIVLAGCGGAQASGPSGASAAAPVVAPAVAAEVHHAPVEGAWHGLLGERLHLGLTLARGPSGYSGSLDSIDQGSAFALQRATFEGGTLRFEIPEVEGSFVGKVDPSGNTIAGTWTQHGHGAPLAFEKGASDAKRELPMPLDAPIDVVAMSPPTALRADDHTHLVYELNITNFSRRDIALRTVDVEAPAAQAAGAAGAAPLAHLDGAALASACGRTSNGEVEIGPGQHVVVYLWVTLAKDAIPTSLAHRFTVRVGDKDMSVANVRVPVRTSAPLILAPPLRGRWWVAGNGPSNTSNHRRALIPIGGHAHIAQRFAIDWVKIDDEGNTFRGTPEKNESYYAYGAEALAVADGVVTATKDGVAQNVPGTTGKDISLESIAGNHVIVDLGSGRFGFWAHFQPGSLRVKVGDRVKRGQVLGLVGNSGNSSEPHLHFHVTDVSSPLGSEGLPYAFDSFQVRAPDKSIAPRTKQMPAENQLVAFP